MHDTIEFEKRGIPAIVVITEAFRKAAVWQFRSKGVDGHSYLEMPHPYGLTMVARVNGEERSRGMSGTMHHKFEDILVHVSKDETVYPGEFFGSGTVGNGSGMEFGRFLKVGDVVELEIDGLGVLRNRVVAPRNL